MLSYRLYGKEDGMSDWGHAMFTDDPSKVDGGYGHGGYYWFAVDSANLTDISDLSAAILDARHNTDIDECYYLPCHLMEHWHNDIESLSDDEFLALFNPTDIVDSAEAYDSETLSPWLWNEVLEPMEVYGIKTQDGAICYDPSLYSRCECPIDD